MYNNIVKKESLNQQSFFRDNRDMFLFQKKGPINKNDFINAVYRLPYPSNYNSYIPGYRYRATLIQKTTANGYEITGIQKNFSQLSGKPVALPTIITIKINHDLIIHDIELLPYFKGSRGNLCDYNYLFCNLQSCLIGKKFLPINLKVSQLHCFHLEEVLLAAFSLLGGIHNSDILQIYEEEISEGHDNDKTINFSNQHYISTINACINNNMIFENGISNIDFADEGNIYIKDTVPVYFYINGNKTFEKILLPEDQPTDIFYKIISLTRSGIQFIKKNILNNCNCYAYNSNLNYKAFIGLFIQSLGLKKYQYNQEKTSVIIETLQRKKNMPLCIGGVRNQNEKTKFSKLLDL